MNEKVAVLDTILFAMINEMYGTFVGVNIYKL